MYYTTDTFFSTPGLKLYMLYNKFKLLDKFLHFVDDEELGDNYPRPAKIQLVWDYVNSKFLMLYMTKTRYRDWWIIIIMEGMFNVETVNTNKTRSVWSEIFFANRKVGIFIGRFIYW